jgi:HSP20 family protein
MINNLFAKKNATPENEEDYSDATEWVKEKESEGQLAIDVYQTPKELIIKAALAGVTSDELKISLHNDLLSIRAFPKDESQIKEEEYFYKECYFGPLSRSIILPADVDNHHVEASLENGVLTIKLHKNTPAKIKIEDKK